MLKPSTNHADSPQSERIRVLYKLVSAEYGSSMYAHIACLVKEHPDDEWRIVRSSAPFVIARQYGNLKVVPGSVYQLIRNFRHEFENLRQSINRATMSLEKLPREALPDAFYEYEHAIKNGLVLLSCLARNLFHMFPRLTENFRVPVFNYEEEQLDETMRTKDLLDMLVHSRYMNLHNEFISDLFSERPPKGSPVIEKFMGYKFEFNQFMNSIYSAIQSITLKDLITQLRSKISTLNISMPHHEMVFLILNIHSFSDLLGAKIPTKKYNFMMDLLFGETEADSAGPANGSTIQRTVFFKQPTVTIADDLSEKLLKIRVDSYVGDNHVPVNPSNNLRSREIDIDYEEFLTAANDSFGSESLLSIGQEMEKINAETREFARTTGQAEKSRTHKTRRRHPTKKSHTRRKK